MKSLRLVLVIALIAITMFLVLPSVSWAADAAFLFSSKCAVCHGKEGRADTPMARKQEIPSFAADRVKKQSLPDLEDFILNGGKEKKSSHAWGHRGLSKDEGTKLAAYVKQLGSSTR